MSAIKTIRWEVQPVYQDQDEEDGDMDLDSEDFEEEEEVEEEEYEGYEHEEGAGAGEGDDDEEGYDVPYLDQQRDPDNSGYTKKRIPATRVLPVADLPDDFEGEATDGATFLALAKSVPRPLKHGYDITLIGCLVDRMRHYPSHYGDRYPLIL